MKVIVSGILIAVSLIHLAPAIGVLGGRWLTSLYGLEFADPNLQILMRHRAVLFGLLGLFLLAAAFRPEWQLLAIIAALVSLVSFILLVWQGGLHNEQLARLLQIDAVAVVGLVIALVVYTR